MLHGIGQDVVLGVRSLVRYRGATAIALLTLGVGIAANATIFSVVQALDFPRLLYPDANRIVFVESRNHARGITGMLVSVPDAKDVAGASRAFESTGVTADQSSVLHHGTGAVRIAGRRVEPTFFKVLGVGASLGRVLEDGDEPGRIVLSHELWRTQFAQDPTVIGRGLRIDGGVVTVVGVMPQRFDADADFWVPLSGAAGAHSRDDRQFMLFARLARGASLQQATLELAEISRRLAADHPASNTAWEMFPVPLAHLHGRDARGTFLLLQGAVAFVLLIACANIANILLARGTARQHEIAVRVSLGASRWRVLRGLLTESVLLSLAGGALGLLGSMWGIRLVRHAQGFVGAIEPHLNVFVLGFTMAVSMLTGITCGILPAFRASRVEPERVLRADARSLSGSSKGWLRAGLVVVQIASAVVLASCAGLMLQTLLNRQRVELGFNPEGAIRAGVQLDLSRYTDPVQIGRTIDAMLTRIKEAPGVTAVGASTWALPTGAGGQRQLTLPDEGNRALPTSVGRGVEAVTPEYFAALGVPLKVGRSFTTGDGGGVAMVNEELARQLWPGQQPVGRTLRLGAASEPAPIVTVVGVVRTIRRSPMHDVASGRVYLPFAAYPNGMPSVVVRSANPASEAIRDLENAVHSVDPSTLVEDARTLEADAARFVAPMRTLTILLTSLGLAGLLLAALGVFGSMSYTVSQRQGEMALRCALGATPGRILRTVFGAALWMIAAGLGVGVAAALATTRTLESFLFGVQPTDWRTLVAVAMVLTVAALVACYRPARIAATADPLPLLRR